MSVDTGTPGLGTAASRVPSLPTIDFPRENSDSALPWGASVDTSAGGTLLPHVVAWNLTRRCNLECSHCYISAGAFQGTEGELSSCTPSWMKRT